MFSTKEKQFIADSIEKLLLSLDHPEMPNEKPSFELHVDGKTIGSWANIKPNWAHSESERANPWNEVARDVLRHERPDGRLVTQDDTIE